MSSRCIILALVHRKVCRVERLSGRVTKGYSSGAGRKQSATRMVVDDRVPVGGWGKREMDGDNPSLTLSKVRSRLSPWEHLTT